MFFSSLTGLGHYASVAWKMSPFVFYRLKKVVQVWNHMRVNKWFSFCLYWLILALLVGSGLACALSKFQCWLWRCGQGESYLRPGWPPSFNVWARPVVSLMWLATGHRWNLECTNALIWLIPHLGHHCGGLLAISSEFSSSPHVND